MKTAPWIHVFVGAGGVGKTTVAAASALGLADAGHRTLVMTFDPSHRLRDTLGLEATESGAEVAVAGHDRLHAALLDAGTTFDGLVERYAPDAAARRRILDNGYYRHLAGSLAGILEYMAVEKLFEVVEAGRYERIVLDTPPVSQALDLIEAPQRIVRFLDSGAVQLATRPWFDADGNLRVTGRLGALGRRVERYLDELVGLEQLRDLVEFFTAFRPLFAGFRQRAVEVEALLRDEATAFTLVTTAAEDRVHDALFLARRLGEAGLRVADVVVNRLHPPVPARRGASPLMRLAASVASREAAAHALLRRLLDGAAPLTAVPMQAVEPTDLAQLRALLGTVHAAPRKES